MTSFKCLIKTHYFYKNTNYKPGDEFTCKYGFFKNYLLPRSIATWINSDTLKQAGQDPNDVLQRISYADEVSNTLVDKLSGLKLQFSRIAQSTCLIFGSITRNNIKHEISKFISKEELKYIELPSISINSVGDHYIDIKINNIFNSQKSKFIKVLVQVGIKN